MKLYLYLFYEVKFQKKNEVITNYNGEKDNLFKTFNLIFYTM